MTVPKTAYQDKDMKKQSLRSVVSENQKIILIISHLLWISMPQRHRLKFFMTKSSYIILLSRSFGIVSLIKVNSLLLFKHYVQKKQNSGFPSKFNNQVLTLVTNMYFKIKDHKDLWTEKFQVTFSEIKQNIVFLYYFNLL